MQELETRLLALASDVLMAVGRGEIPADAPVVRAAAAALGELRRPAATPESAVATKSGGALMAAAAGARAPRVAPPIEQVLAVARHMRAHRAAFAAACARVGDELGVSAQAVRNACTRWLGASAADWQPLVIEGAGAGVSALARRAAERSPWLRDRVADEFGVDRRELAAAS